MKKNQETIAAEGEDLSNLHSIRPWIGLKVLSKSGEKLGKIHDLLYEDFSISAILVQYGMVKIVISRKFVAERSEKSVVLSVDPVTLLRGKKVFDSEGKYIGKVIDIERQGDGNNLISIKARKKFYKAPIEIPHKELDVIKKNIILNVSK